LKPLVLDDPLAGALYFGCLGAWTVAEVVLAIRTTGAGTESDRSHIPRFVGIGAAFVLAVYVAANATSLSLSDGAAWPVVVGLSLALAGAVYRYWAIHTLGRFFVFVVAVQEDHRVIDTGPYAIVRHPSYLGLLVSAFGFSLALDNWAALAIGFLPPLISFVRRIVVEERFLLRELGDSYREYAERTYRLVPGIW
jgi:protein-S-isoprenylcysteine O-methyltransferase Ste14